MALLYSILQKPHTYIPIYRPAAASNISISLSNHAPFVFYVIIRKWIFRIYKYLERLTLFSMTTVLAAHQQTCHWASVCVCACVFETKDEFFNHFEYFVSFHSATLSTDLKFQQWKATKTTKKLQNIFVTNCFLFVKSEIIINFE